ncbi:MAG: LysE family translocator [Anaerolineae bacterium]|nr:LysE family translocator [Anaerolineae bacterium]
MTFALWLTFTLAAGTLIAIPGPTNVMVMACGLRHGTKPALSTVFGIVPGVMSAMLLSFLGLGAILATSSHLFELMKWAGAIYLVYLGIKQWRSEPALVDAELAQPQSSGRAIIGQAFTVTFLNPKGIIFYIAFMPQFIAPNAPVLPQLLLLGATFIALVFPINTAYALLAGNMRRFIQNQRTLRWMNRTGGAMLVGAGILTASLKRA